jgi:tetratricopeptide (TPR) repeat protein
MKVDWISIFALAALCGCLLSERMGAQNPSQDEAFRRLFNAGQAAKADGRFTEAVDDFERLEKMDASVAEVHATLGVLYFQQGNFAGAISEIHEARRLKPSLPGLDSLLAFSLAEAGREREALPGLERAFRPSSDAAVRRQAGLELMRAYSHLDMDREAVETSMQMRDLYKDDPEVLYNVGKVLGNSAYITMQTLFHHAGNSAWTQLAEAEAQESQGQTDLAIGSYRHVLAIDPHRPGIHYRIGRVYLARFNQSKDSGDRDSALREFEAELAGDPGNGNARYEIAVLDANEGDLKDAGQQYEEILARYPDFEEALVGLAGVQLDGQKPSDAIPLLEHATRLRPEDGVAWYRLSLADRASGDKAGQAKALAEFQRLRNSAPTKLRKPDSGQDVTPQTIGDEKHPGP